MNHKLADIRNFPELKEIVRNEAAFFWKKTALNYAKELIKKAPLDNHVQLVKL
jgi:hypothetical protein